MDTYSISSVIYSPAFFIFLDFYYFWIQHYYYNYKFSNCLIVDQIRLSYNIAHIIYTLSLLMFDFLKQGQVSLKDMEKAIQELPLPEKIRALAIYKRYKKIRQIEDKMSEETKALQKSYLKLDAPLLQNVSALVQGKKEITEGELKDLNKYLTEEEIGKVKENLGARKLPEYWYKVLSNSNLIKEQIGQDDEPLLKAIDNIHVVDEQGTDNFTIVFDFADNEIITNKQLTKKFTLKNDEAVKTESTIIQWKGKNLTVKQVKKKQKNKKTGQQRVVTKTVQAKSFFNFFKNLEAPPVATIEQNEQQLKKREAIDNDFEIGGVLVDQVLPYSLEYYLGIEHEGDEGFGDEGEDGEDQDDEDDHHDHTENKKKKKSKEKEKSKSKGKNKDAAAQKPECKNQ